MRGFSREAVPADQNGRRWPAKHVLARLLFDAMRSSYVVHFERYVQRIVLRNQPRNLHAPLCVGSFCRGQCLLALCLVKVVLLGTPLLQLDQEIPKVLYKLRRLPTLVEAIEHEDFNLASVQRGEGFTDEIEKEFHHALLGRYLRQHAALHRIDQVEQDVLLQFETRFVQRVRQHAEHVLQDAEVIQLEERFIHLRRTRKQPLQKLLQDL
mmetsp:Transcript_106818/g.300293  ORF Transcript_106818/g.300293 Transcript_106818/m.300293 type:complete len:210 (-) Transcript_106818:670-1299(-)